MEPSKEQKDGEKVRKAREQALRNQRSAVKKILLSYADFVGTTRDPIKIDVEAGALSDRLVKMMNTHASAAMLALLTGLKKGVQEWLDDNGKAIVDELKHF